MPKRFDYNEERQQQNKSLRTAILDAAAQRLHDGGPKNMSVRAIASDVGASTKVIYGNFGNKAGIIKALYDDGFEQQVKVLLEAVKLYDDPIDKLFALTTAWLEFADQNRRLYELMYGPQIRDLLPDESDREMGIPLYTAFVELIDEVLQATQTTEYDIRSYVRSLWVILHGSASLEITMWMTTEEASLRANHLVSSLFEVEPN